MSEEIFPLVNEQGQVIGQASRAICHGGSMYLHPVVHVHIFNSKGDIYLQQRAFHKDTQPGKWDTAVGGHVDFGEDVSVAVLREMYEELGIQNQIPLFAYNYIWESPIEREYVHVFTLHYDGVIIPSKDELEGGRFYSIPEVKTLLGKNFFTPNFEHDFNLLVDKNLIHC